MDDQHDENPALPPQTRPAPSQQEMERQLRAERVARALRENLLKRKQQARARADNSGESGDSGK